MHIIKLLGQNHKFYMILPFPQSLFVIVRKGGYSSEAQDHLRGMWHLPRIIMKKAVSKIGVYHGNNETH